MSDDQFIAYVGDPDFHDGHVLRVVREVDKACVVVRGASAREYAVEFRRVKTIKSNRPDGMMLYALVEMRGEPPIRRFVFANWDDEDDASLELEAEEFLVTPLT
jgi:hypothetical protein